MAPIVARECAGCHQAGDIAPFPLTTWDEARPWAEVMAEVTAEGTMPPWPPSADCAPLADARALSADEVALFAAWAEAGAPEGDPADAVEVPAVAPFVGDLELAMDVDYTPLPDADDYRCFVVDWPLTEPTYATAYQVFPGARQLVHHVILYLADAGAAHDADAGAPGAGYPCFGSAGVSSTMLGSWVPGVSGVELPPDTGVAIQPGQAVVMQVHYNTLAADTAPDRTSVALKLADEVAWPAAPILYTDPAFLAGGMDIPAGDPDVVHTTSVSGGILGLLATGIGGSLDDPLRLQRVGLHMHLLGSAIRLDLERADGSRQCVLDIPRWDFHWQGGYNLAEPLAVERGDTLTLTCHWDNSAAGAVDVNWGEGTTDEMCLSGLYVTR